MGLLDILHAIVNYFLSWVRLAQNSEYGWKSLDRKTGRLMREQQPLTKKLKLWLLFNPLTEWLDTTHAMRLHMHQESAQAGKEEKSGASKKQIKGFVETYGINMADFEPSDVDKYRTFAEFFTRRHRAGSRPIFAPDDDSKAVAVADSRVVVYESVAETKRLWIKGADFSITNLVMDTQLGARFDGAAVASFRLSPQDYHRYHSPVSGTIKLFRSMPGDYYQVDPVALRSHVDILTRNARDYVVIDTKEFGEVLFIAIGATDVGTVNETGTRAAYARIITHSFNDKWQKPGAEIRKGDELGLFQFGGSSIIVAFQKGRIKFDQDLLDLSRQKIQVSVEVGMSLGSAV
ncbi:hypothetical protein DL771_006786 [Monosporascus sp. 5C6A]|nr:hypothetical protein DL771_006786 [Monosporascus sp. 5C6A]